MTKTGIKTTELTTAAAVDSVVGNRNGQTVVLPFNALKSQIIGDVALLPTPNFHIASNPAETTAAIQAVLDTRDHVLIPAGGWVIDRSLIVKDNQQFEMIGKLERADGMFDTVIRNSQAIAYAVGNVHPGSSHPFSERNVYFPDASGAVQEWWVDGVLRAKTFDIFMDTYYNYDSGAGLVAVGDVVGTADGLKWEVTAADASNTPVVNKNGVKFIPALNHNVNVFMRPGSVLDGNGTNNRDGDFIDWQQFLRKTTMFVGIDGYTLKDLSYENAAQWNCMIAFCRNGRTRDMSFNQQSYLVDGIENGDGLDMVQGNHNCHINGIHGATSDDCLMIGGGIYPKQSPTHDHDDPKNLYPKRMGTLNSVFEFRHGDYGSSFISASNITAIPVDGHEQVRLFNADGRTLDNVVVDLRIDPTTHAKLSGKYNRPQQAAQMRVGSSGYGMWPAAYGDMSNITIIGASGHARSLVRVEWSVKNLTIDGVSMDYDATAGYDPETGTSVIRSQTAVTLAGGNEIIDMYRKTATAGQTVFAAPRFYRQSQTLTVMPFILVDNLFTIDATGHDYTMSFRATVKFWATGADPATATPIAGPVDFTVAVERDETTEIPTGNFLISVTDKTQLDLAAMPATGQIIVEAQGNYRSMVRKQNVDNSRYGNGSLKVSVNGVDQVAGVDYTETPDVDPDLEQVITFATSLTLADDVHMDRHEFAAAHQMKVSTIARNIDGRGDKPNQHPVAEKEMLEWGVVFMVNRFVDFTADIQGVRAKYCRHLVEVSQGSKVDLRIDGVRLDETSLMPIRFHPDSDWENSKVTLRNMELPDRDKIWQYYDPALHAKEYLGQAFSGRNVFKYEGTQPSVRAETATNFGDVYPIWARDGSELDFEAGAFPGLAVAVKARKIGDYGDVGDHWAAYALTDGTPLDGLVMPSAVTGGNLLTITSGKNFRNTATPAIGFSVLVKPDATNTGTIMVKVDDMDAVEAHVATRDGVTLPADYLLAGIETKAVWDGSRWVVHRQVENIENANGHAARHEDGRVEMWNDHVGDGNVSAGPSNGLYRPSVDVVWTYPVALVGVDDPVINSIANSTARTGGGALAVQLESATLMHYAASASATETGIGGTLTGVWF